MRTSHVDAGRLITHAGKPYRIIETRIAREGDIIVGEPLSKDLTVAGDPVDLLADACTPASIDLGHLAQTGERRLYQRRTDG